MPLMGLKTVVDAFADLDLLDSYLRDRLMVQKNEIGN
jgi:hypothetical protein